ncbi:MAG: hypothetical protein JNK49_07885 [Planctomycetes bacterium]|nr:hypothetical protein [Planctomycetota bacterium]
MTAASVAPIGPEPVLQIRAAVVPGRTEVTVGGAPPGEPVLLLFGRQAGRTTLPGGAVVDLVPEVVGGQTPADALGNATFEVGFPPGRAPGETFFAQAVSSRVSTATGPALPAVSACCPLRIPAPADAVDVYLLFGQSNAEGYAAITGLPAALRAPLPGGRIWNPRVGRWQAVHAGVNNTTAALPRSCGPELTLLDRLAGAGAAVYLLKCAVGQTSLGPNPGPWNEWGPGAGELYALLLQQLDAGLAALRGDRLAPRVRGICMMQGESDALSAAAAAGYGPRLQTLLDRLRADLRARHVAFVADTPFVVGLVDAGLPAAVFPGTAAVRAAQCAVVDASPRCDGIETTGMPRQADQVHLDTAGVMQLGAAFAAALRQLGA